MKCEEFRKTILDGKAEETDLLKHISVCEECKKWLQEEIKTAPEGVSQEKWASLKNESLAKGNDNKIIEPKTEEIPPDEKKSFMDYYLSGLKYGIVLGLAIIIGFSLVQTNNDKKEEKIKKEKIEANSITASNSVELTK